MIFLFFPTMTMLTFELIWTAIFVASYKLAWTPILALIFWIKIQLGLPSEILPVMRIDTRISDMFGLIVRAPYRLKVEHVEVKIFLELINQLYWYLRFWVCKWTIIPIFTLTCTIYVRRTEFRFILIRVIELFYSVMSFCAKISIGTLFSLCNVLAHFRLISSQRSSLIFLLIMIIWTSFEVVGVRISFARKNFENG